MNGGHARFASGQVPGGLRGECGDNDPFLLHGFGIVIGRLAKCGCFAAFDADDARGAVGNGEFKLVSGQRRALGIHKDIHRAKASAVFLTNRLLRMERRRQPKNKQERQAAHEPPFSSRTALAATNSTSFSSTTPSPFRSSPAVL